MTRTHSEERAVSSIKGVGKTGSPHAKQWNWDFPGGQEVKNPPCNAGEADSLAYDPTCCEATEPEAICSRVCVAQLDSLCAATKDPSWHNEDTVCCN